MTAIPYAFYTTINVILVAAFAGPAAAAAFTASRTLINPAMAVVSAIDTLDKPRAARALFKDGLAGLHRSIRRTLLTVIGLTGPYLALLSLFSGFVLHLVFGQTFMPYALGVSILSVAAIFACLNQAPETALIVLKAGRAMFAVRLFAGGEHVAGRPVVRV
jgi:O-antigen/teichoic acid export membrane protein